MIDGIRKSLLCSVVILISIGICRSQQPIVISGATLIDGTGKEPVKNSVIIIEGSRITAVGVEGKVKIPDGATMIDARGKYIIPGLIDCHIHYEQPRDLVQLLAWGVTSVNCMFESTDQALAMEKMTASDTIHSPQIYATAPIFTTVGGWWHGEGFPNDSTINRFPSTPEEAREQVRKVKAKGIKRIKLMYDDMGWCRDSLSRLAKMKYEVMKALLDEAREQNLFPQIHVPQLEDAQEVALARNYYGKTVGGGELFTTPVYWGSCAFAHGVIDDTIPSPHVWIHTRYVPTFCIFHFLADVKGFMNNTLADDRFRSALPIDQTKRYTSEEYYEHYRKAYPNISFVKSHLNILDINMKRLYDAHDDISMGTDMWAFPGIGAHLELEYMVHAGMTPKEAVVSATEKGARFLGELNLGMIKNTYQADLLILDVNPLDDIRNTRSVRTIIKHGVIFDHQQLIDESKR